MPHIAGIFGGGAGAGAEAPPASLLVGSGVYTVYTGTPAFMNLFTCPVISGPAISGGQMVWGQAYGECQGFGDPKNISVNISPTNNVNGGQYIQVQPLATVRFWQFEFWIVRLDSSNIFAWLRYQGMNSGGALLEQYFPSPNLGMISSTEADPLYLWLRASAAANSAVSVYSTQIYRQ